MEINWTPSWQRILSDEITSCSFNDLMAFVETAYLTHSDSVFPPKNQVFNAFEKCSFEQVKVVLLGQDPYPTKGHANGLSFSVHSSVKPLPRSLQNIFKEIQTDLQIELPENGDLTRWATQGVLLLNDVLTVEEGKAGSHQKKGWEVFTKNVIEKINAEKENVVFLLWGNQAQKKAKWIDEQKHLILFSGHPSPLSANKGKWFGNKHFSKTNEYLRSKGLSPIEW